MAAGRPREFDRDEALGRAMELFWRKGYQDTSIADLTEHLGIGSPSLYAAFGSKAELFCEAADRYQRADGGVPYDELEAASTARQGVEALLRGNVALFTRRGRARGCLLTRARLSCPDDEAVVERYLQVSRRQRLQVLRSRLERAIEAGESIPGGDPRTTAVLYDALVQGLAVSAIEGGSRRELDAAVDVALAGWDPALGVVSSR